MKVEIEIKKKDLRSILCAAIRNYYCDVKMQLEPRNAYSWQSKTCDEDITDNLYDIRDACDAIANLCNLIDELDVADNERGVIRFDDSGRNRNVLKKREAKS